MSRAIIPNWNNTSGDIGWVCALLAWYESARGLTSSQLSVETSQQTRRPGLFETLQLTDKNELFASRSGELFATFSTTSKVQPLPPSRQVLQHHTYTVQVRASDRVALTYTPLAFFWRCVSESFPLDRADTRRVHVLKTSVVVVSPGQELVISYCAGNDASNAMVYEITCEGQSVCAIEVETLTEEEEAGGARNVREASLHSEYVINANRTRHQYDVPSQCTLVPFPFELRNGGASYLEFGTLTVMEIISHIFPTDCYYYVDRQPSHPDLPRYTMFWRSASIQVFEDFPNVNGGGLQCVTWIERMGSSSMDTRTDFYLVEEDGRRRRLVAAMHITQVMLDREVNRPAAIRHDKEWLARRYEYGKQSPVPFAQLRAQPGPKTWPSAESAFFFHPVQLRRADEDANGHVNSAKYLVLVEDAKLAAQRAGFLPSAHLLQELLPCKFWVDYLEEMHADTTQQTGIRVHFHVSAEDNATLVMRYEYVKHPQGNACVVVLVESRLLPVNNNKL